MKKMIQPFCNTSEVLAEISKLGDFKNKNWDGFSGNGKTFGELQESVKKEYDYLHSFWEKDESGEISTVKDDMFIPWNCLPAFYDFPQESRDYVIGRGRYKRWIKGFDKYDVFHEREHYLENILWEIFGLFHDWQFVTQGWTAY